ncbi:MAG: methyltransferase domain-containing protein [Candidatus Rickettsia vulgarisii]
MKEFHFNGFGNLDNDKNADFLINSMSVMHSLEDVQSIKKRVISNMNLNTGDTVLEVGCGYGDDAEEIARVIGMEGEVVAVDLSEKMINEAKKRSKQSNVNYTIMSAENLKFNDNSFSACHADRLLVGHQDYYKIFDEILRVTRPSGTICITDVDALSIIMYPFNNYTGKILKQIQESFVNPFMGRMVPEIFAKRNLKNITVLPEPLMIQDFEILSKIFPFDNIMNELIANDKLTVFEAKSWMNEMLKASQEGNFLYCVTLFTVIGQK